MVDFKTALSQQTPLTITNPIDIYKGLDRASDTGPLRPAQESILKSWHENHKDKKDLIIKLHTGQGKTLIGLLILMSRLNDKKSPCLYICPNIYLVDQTCEQAKKFGIPFVRFDENNKNIPIEFENGEAILITHVQKVFNGLSKFKLNNHSLFVDSVVLDDSHACIDSIKDSFTIKVKNDHPIYTGLLEIFSEDLKQQGEGTFIEVNSGEYNSFLPVPYWVWEDKIDAVTKILSDNREHKNVIFAWALIKDYLKNCQCIISGTSLQIAPYFNPLNQFGSFENAKHRVLMSATTLDDSSLVKGLGLSKEAILNPLVDHNEKWSGEKMIIIPFLIDDKIDRADFINNYAKPRQKRDRGIVALVPSGRQTDIYAAVGCQIADSEKIFDQIKQLKNGDRDRPLVIANRYDGIDLPDDSCRLLILDSKPIAINLVDRYEEHCRPNSEIITMKVAQKIEQGLGRSVRGEKDYSAIAIIGEDLVNFIRTKKNYKYFSEQTLKQIDIGLTIAKMANKASSTSSGEEQIFDLIKKCTIDRDSSWKQFYEENMNTITVSNKEYQSINILYQEKISEEEFKNGNIEKAIAALQKINDEFISDDDEKGWYLQSMARFMYRTRQAESNKLQKSAFEKNPQLLKPKEGFVYKKISFVSQERIENILKWLKQFDSTQEMFLKVNAILDNLDFSSESEKFELGLKELGVALGFISQRPDKENKAGPDNLWCGDGDSYFLFECKNEVKETRASIKKEETGQMNNSCAWFKREYKGSEFSKFMIIHTHEVSSDAGFNDSDVRIIKKQELKALRTKVKNLFKEFLNLNLQDINHQYVQDLLNTHELDVNSLKTKYSKLPFQRR